MRILHTSDWHIGRKLKDHDRSEEFRNFFCWLEDIIRSENIDVLLVAGDIFDTRSPSVTSQEIYYSFLGRIAKNTSCRHIVITAGNHDYPAFLDAPAELLKLSRINVIGRASPNPADEVITLLDTSGNPELIVCAVPYLRDSDTRLANPDDSFDDMENAIRSGIMNHYAEVFRYAHEVRKNLDIPIIAMGHLFLEHGKTFNDEGIRSLYVGTAVKVGTDIFPEDTAYTALGHLHSAQSIGRENIRYSGSPIAMTFGESYGAKSVSIVELDGKDFVGIKDITVPVFQRMERVSGDEQTVSERIRELAECDESIWLEVTCTDSGDIRGRLNNYAKDFDSVEIISFREDNAGVIDDIPADRFNGKGLEDIDSDKIFEYLLESKNISEEERVIYRKMYDEVLHKIASGDYDE